MEFLKMTREPGDTGEFIRVDEDKCTACGRCEKICGASVWVEDADAGIFRPKNLSNCAECGACWDVCEPDAVIMEEPKGGTGVIFPDA